MVYYLVKYIYRDKESNLISFMIGRRYASVIYTSIFSTIHIIKYRKNQITRFIN